MGDGNFRPTLFRITLGVIRVKDTQGWGRQYSERNNLLIDSRPVAADHPGAPRDAVGIIPLHIQLSQINSR